MMQNYRLSVSTAPPPPLCNPAPSSCWYLLPDVPGCWWRPDYSQSTRLHHPPTPLPPPHHLLQHPPPAKSLPTIPSDGVWLSKKGSRWATLTQETFHISSSSLFLNVCLKKKNQKFKKLTLTTKTKMFSFLSKKLWYLKKKFEVLSVKLLCVFKSYKYIFWWVINLRQTFLRTFMIVKLSNNKCFNSVHKINFAFNNSIIQFRAPLFH